jgi:outer membrane receptor protein involved in Fe transport
LFSIRIATAFVAFFILGSAATLADTTGIVRGTATVDGHPTADVVVTLSGEGTDAKTTTDKNGAFVFARVTYGHYTITAHEAGYPDVTTTVDVASSSIATVNMAISKLKEIGHAQATSHGVGGSPVSVNTLGQQQIAVSPNNNSLNSLVQSVPGIVKFSYNEPVAHGFHGLTYEIDGAPLPQASTQDFSEVIDPKTIDSLEVMTGAYPAEYGGARMGAVVNVVSRRLNDFPGESEGYVTLGGGSYGSLVASLSESLKLGASQLSFNINNESSDRGLDSPTFVPVHDHNSLADAFLRFITPAGKNATLALDLSGQTGIYQIPINTTFNPNDPVISPSAMDDVQREYQNFANLVYTRTTNDGLGYTLIAPWYEMNRTVYAGDLPNDTKQVFLDPSASTCPQPSSSSLPPVTQCFLGGLDQNRWASYAGLRITQFRASAHHAIKYGIDTDREFFHSGQTVALNPASVIPPGQPITSNFVQQTGSNFGAYIEDKWTASRYFTMNMGLRYDYSNGFVQGNQISPRIGFNLQVDPKDVFHAYYGRLYAAPFLEDTRETCVQIQACTTGIPVYNLKPEHDSYTEFGIQHTFSPTTYGYFNGWYRIVSNVLDTTQLFPTPIFAVFNNSVGNADGVELRLVTTLRNSDTLTFTGNVSESLAGGISGGTFLFAPSDVSDNTLEPEDHDQTYSSSLAYTHRFGGPAKAYYATLSPQYGSGYPVEFENGQGRLPTHLTFDGVVGRLAAAHRVGFQLGAENMLGHAYIIKIANGFNTTQWAQGFRAYFRLNAPI